MRTLQQLKEAKRERLGQSTRSTRQAMYQTKEWKRYVKEFRAEHPLCTQCLKNGQTKPTWAVDHIMAHGGNDALFWSVKNHQPLCMDCHNRKSWGEVT